MRTSSAAVSSAKTLKETLSVVSLALPAVTVTVAVVVCVTLVCTVACAKLVGCSLPMLAKRLGFDPAVMASPFITTIVDAISLLIYFRFTTLILGI